MQQYKGSKMKVFTLFCLTFIFYKCQAINIDNITLSNCRSGSHCDDTININIGASNSTEKINILSEDVNNIDSSLLTTENAIYINATTSNALIIGKSLPMPIVSTADLGIYTLKSATDSNKENHQNICTCDVTVSLCDINSCCNANCNSLHLFVSSNYGCHQPNIYDSRYCYTKNFIHRNNTRFILERLASNLFCIAYDNLPPIYAMEDALDIGGSTTLEDAKYAMNRKKYLWHWRNMVIPPEFNISSQYHKKDGLWKFQNNMVTLIELPQSGFTGECKLGKILEYLETSKWICMQSDLSNNNTYLFTKAYDNFTVISSPHLLNLSYIIAENHTCPNNICVPVRSLYCLGSLSLCNSTKSLEQSCLNGDCRNVVKRIRYTIALNSTCGIQSIEIRYELTNTSESFYQYFEVTFESDYGMAGNIYSRSGHPGYIVGNPIITGTLARNNTNHVITEYINVNKSDSYLTLPLSRHNGDCDSRKRYIVGFGEDIRLKCRVKLTTRKFSSHSCIDLQNQTLTHLLDNSLHGATEIDKYNTFVSRTGDISKNKTLDWTHILLDSTTRNVVTGQIYNNRIRCSGLLTSLNMNILFTKLPKDKDPSNYKIAGVSITVLEPIDISWPKCIEPNCNNVLEISLASFVSFTDVSTPSMYYYAGKPNLDISLPYDFFYPFMSGTDNAKPTHFFIQSVSVIIILNLSIFQLA